MKDKRFIRVINMFSALLVAQLMGLYVIALIIDSMLMDSIVLTVAISYACAIVTLMTCFIGVFWKSEEESEEES